MRCDRWFGSQSARHRRRGLHRPHRRRPHLRGCAGGRGSHPSHSGTLVAGDPSKGREHIRDGDLEPWGILDGGTSEVFASIRGMPSPRRGSGSQQSLAFNTGRGEDGRFWVRRAKDVISEGWVGGVDLFCDKCRTWVRV